MKKILQACCFALFFLFFFVQMAQADLDSFLLNLNGHARADLPGFSSTLSVHFKVPVPQVDALMKVALQPADAFMCLQLSRMTGIRLERVVKIYEGNHGKGWGVIAKELGIKPGSDAFHALKQGNFILPGFAGEARDNRSKKKNKGNRGNKGKSRKNK